MASRTPLDSLSQDEADRVRELLTRLGVEEAEEMLGVCEVTALRMTIPGRKLHRGAIRLVRQSLATYDPNSL